MKKTTTCLIAAVLCLSTHISDAWANDVSQDVSAKQSCVLMEFTNDTRFNRLQPEKLLSDLVMEKMIASGKFNLKETRPLAQETADMLYNENSRLVGDLRTAMNDDNFTPLFDRLGFNDEGKQAPSISVAVKGQIVTPSLTSKIGQAHNAEYLVQGNISNIGHFSYLNQASQNARAGVGLLGEIIGGRTGGVLTDLAGSYEDKETSAVILGDIRLIKTTTGEVVWQKSVISGYKQDKIKAVGVTTGSDTLHMDLVVKAVDQMAQKIVDTLVDDMDQGKLFVK